MKFISPTDKKLADWQQMTQLAAANCGGCSMDNLLVSVIVNNYNYGRFLRQAIDSALNQTYSHVEVIAVDDGSTDNSREIIASYGDKIIPVLKENGGQASAFNAGFAVSQGELISFLDADDYLFADTIERIVSVWKPGIAKVQYYLDVVDTKGNFLGTYPPRERRLDNGEVLPILLEKGRYETPVTSGNSFNRSGLNKIFPIPESKFQISADSYLVTLAPFDGQVVAIEQTLGAYRIHGDNLWALSQKVEIEKLAQFVQHDLYRYELLADKFSEIGYKTPNNLSYRDYLHLKNRIASLRLNPKNHPVSFDSSIVLACRGVWAVWRYSELSWQKQILFITWFIWVGLMPLPIVKPAIDWLFVPQSRPASLDWIGNKFKRALEIANLSFTKNTRAGKC